MQNLHKCLLAWWSKSFPWGRGKRARRRNASPTEITASTSTTILNNSAATILLHKLATGIWQCVTSSTFCWLFSCLVTSVVCYPCDILVRGMMSSDCYEIKYHSFLVWANLYFHVLFNTFLKLRTFQPMREFESGLSHVLLIWIFGSFHSSANSRNDHDRLSRSQHNWCCTFLSTLSFHVY